METVKNTIESVKYAIIMKTHDLDAEQFARLDAALNEFANKHHDIVDKISVNKQIVGVL